jgi:hypothetical protein
VDFTLTTYKNLLEGLKKQGFVFQTFQEFLTSPAIKAIILRHDVDKLPANSLRFAQIQHKLGIRGSYYFRMVPESPPAGRAGFNPEIIREIVRLGHEIGYHYEDVDFAFQQNKKQDKRRKIKENKEKELADEAIVLFEKHLTELRKYYPVKTICMHGSPLSKYDNKLIWKYYNYRDYGIIGEPYFDVDFSNVLYLTDTGRRWNGEKVSIRDKVNISGFPRSPYPLKGQAIPLGNKRANEGQIKIFKSTFDIIRAANNGKLPDQIMFTFHPQRWTDKSLPWIKELVLQNVKNSIKYFLNRTRK